MAEYLHEENGYTYSQEEVNQAAMDRNISVQQYLATAPLSILGSNNSLLQELKATDADELYIAMRNLLGKDEVFVGSVAYGEVNNFAHFIGIENGEYNRFKVDYIDKLTQLHINANYDRRINHIMSVNINADFYQWDTLVYYKPNFTCELSTLVNLRNKIREKLLSSNLCNAPRYALQIEKAYQCMWLNRCKETV